MFFQWRLYVSSFFIERVSESRGRRLMFSFRECSERTNGFRLYTSFHVTLSFSSYRIMFVLSLNRIKPIPVCSSLGILSRNYRSRGLGKNSYLVVGNVFCTRIYRNSEARLRYNVTTYFRTSLRNGNTHLQLTILRTRTPSVNDTFQQRLPVYLKHCSILT